MLSSSNGKRAKGQKGKCAPLEACPEHRGGINSVNIKKKAYWLALASMDGIGTKRLKQLIERFGTAEKVFDASMSEIACLPRFNPLLASRILSKRDGLNNFQQQLDYLNRQGIEILCIEDERYPQQLKGISGAPLILCKRGHLKQINRRAVAFVGTRTPTTEGLSAAKKLATILASEGLIIVSGLARGIDTAAHQGALEADGITVGVLGCDILTIYPKENRSLTDAMCARGAVISEHLFSAQPTPANLVQRNRLISGLSLGVIVIECDVNDGAMHTARFAKNQSRRVYAYHWPSHHPLTEGTNKLIMHGAMGIDISDVSHLIADLRKAENEKISMEKQLELF